MSDTRGEDKIASGLEPVVQAKSILGKKVALGYLCWGFFMCDLVFFVVVVFSVLQSQGYKESIWPMRGPQPSWALTVLFTVEWGDPSSQCMGQTNCHLNGPSRMQSCRMDSEECGASPGYLMRRFCYLGWIAWLRIE